MLADAFTELFAKMTLGRQLSQRDPLTWLSHVRSQLVAKPIQLIFAKHHALLFGMFLSCLASSSPSSHIHDEDENNDEDNTSTTLTTPSMTPGCVQRITIRSVLFMLRQRSASTAEPVFSNKFHVRDALQALYQAFADMLPDADAVSTTGAACGEKPHNEDPGPDAFFADTLLVYSEFLDAIAVVQFAKHNGLSFLPESSTEHAAALQTPLHALVDSFLQGLQRETKA